MSAVVLAFPDRRGNRPSPMNPPVDVVSKLWRYSERLGLSERDCNTVIRGVQHFQQIGLAEDQVAARAMAMANRLALSHNPDPSGPRAA